LQTAASDIVLHFILRLQCLDHNDTLTTETFILLMCRYHMQYLSNLSTFFLSSLLESPDLSTFYRQHCAKRKPAGI